VKKIRNMENIGVSVGIIINDSDEGNIENVLMSDDGTGGGIRIPSMLIPKTEGLKLLNFLKKASQQELDSTAIMAEFIMNKPDNRVEYDLWFTSSNDRALDFVADFKEFDQKFGDKVLFTPHYVFWKCTFCEEQYLKNDCFGGGKYCAVEPSNSKQKGRQIIEEDLREKCLYNKFYQSTSTRHIWWAYMEYIHAYCYNIINQDCSRNAHKKLGISFEETQKCVSDSFSSSDWASNSTVNQMIEEEIEYWRSYGTGIYPSLVINNRTYRGQIEPLAVQNAICAGFEKPPAMCLATLKSYTPDFLDEGNFGAGTLVLIVLGLILANVVIVCCYRRYTKREMHQNMNVQIESAVSQYFALSKEDTKKPYQA